MDLDSISEYLKSSLSYKRYIHSINTSTMAASLARLYGCDTGKAALAGLIHDCAREQEHKLLQEYIAVEGIETDELTLTARELMHGPAAVHLCKRVFGIEDDEVLAAIRYHTTGRENMSLLEKIIYLSDFIEPSRCYDGVQQLRDTAWKDLDKALLMAFDSSIRYVMSKNGLIHVDTVLARNYMLRQVRREWGQASDIIRE